MSHGFAEHEYINRRRMRVQAGVGATVDQLPVSQFRSGQPPLVVPGGPQPSSDYLSAPEFPGAWFYAGKLPTPVQGQPLVPPHLNDSMYAAIQSSTTLSPLARSLKQYYEGYKRMSGTAYASGLVTSDPNRQHRTTIIDKVTGLFTKAGGEGLLAQGKSLLGMGPAVPQTAVATTSRGSGGGFLDALLSPVGLVLGVVGAGATAYAMKRGGKKQGRRRR